MLTKIIKHCRFMQALAVLFMSSQIVEAEAPGLPSSPVFSDKEAVINKIADIAGWIGALVFVLSIIFILIAAFQFVTSSGDPEKVKTARQTIIYAAVGIVVALLSTSVGLVIASILGTDIVGM